MLAATRLTRAAMPGLVEGSEPAGMLRTEVAEAWGVRRVSRAEPTTGAAIGRGGHRRQPGVAVARHLRRAVRRRRGVPDQPRARRPQFSCRRPAGRGHRAGAVRELRAAAPVGEWFRTASVVRQSHRRAVGRDQDLAVASLAPDVVPVRIGSDRNVLRSRRPPERAGGQDVGLLTLNMNDSPARDRPRRGRDRASDTDRAPPGVTWAIGLGPKPISLRAATRNGQSIRRCTTAGAAIDSCLDGHLPAGSTARSPTRRQPVRRREAASEPGCGTAARPS